MPKNSSGWKMPRQTSDVLHKIDSYYTSALQRHGATPQGVDWNSVDAQVIRFRQVTKIIETPGGYSLNDFGCGYGALVDFLGEGPDRYTGFDVSESMIAEARKLHEAKNRIFTAN